MSDLPIRPRDEYSDETGDGPAPDCAACGQPAAELDPDYAGRAYHLFCLPWLDVLDTVENHDKVSTADLEEAVVLLETVTAEAKKNLRRKREHDHLRKVHRLTGSCPFCLGTGRVHVGETLGVHAFAMCGCVLARKAMGTP